jgi:methyltransferase OMS1, mitochondrial
MIIINPVIFVVLIVITSKTRHSTVVRSKWRDQVPEKRRKFLIDLLGYSFPIFQRGPNVDALSPSEASSAYDSYAPKYDLLDGGEISIRLGLDEARSQLFHKAKGNVLEIGVGTGLNFAKYDANQIKSLTVVDISEGMIEQARSKAKSLVLSYPVDFVKADATSELVNKFGKDRFDTVVDSFSLCVMGDTGAKHCLKQISDVVKPVVGRVLLLENSRSSSPALGWYQDLTASVASSVGGKGCVYNQDVSSMIKETSPLKIVNETIFLTGLFRSFECIKET